MKKLLAIMSTIVLMTACVMSVGCGGEPEHVHEYVKGVCECGEKQVGYYTPGLTFELDANGSDYIVKKFNNSTGSVIIPEEYEGKPVTGIASDAFLACSRVANISLPSNLKAIGDYAFYGSRLVSVTIPENVESMGVGVFQDCTWLKSITYSAKNCAAFSKGTFDNAGTSVEEGTVVTITKNVKSVPDYFLCPVAYSSSPKVTSVIFEDNSECEWIGVQAFWDLRGLEKLSFGENSNLKEIKDSAFGNVGWLTELNDVVIPASVEKISSYALAFIKLNKDPANIIFENLEGWHYTVSRADYDAKANGTAITDADLIGNSLYYTFGSKNFLYRIGY